jgi:uncharacterized protein (TIGR02246 family)
MKNSFFKLLTFFAFFAFAQNAIGQANADEQALRNLIGKAIDDYYAGDADKLAAYYAENATMVIYTGQKINGRAAIRESVAEGFKIEKPTPANFKFAVASVRFLNANLAIVVADLKGTSQMDGKTIEWSGVSTLVFSRSGGKWLIELESNTPVMSMPGN